MQNPLDRHPLRRDLVSEVVERLLTGRLPEGRVNESELAAQLGVSRTPLREALVVLEQRGLVVSAMGRGFLLRPCSAAEARELYPLLALLEPFALRSAPEAARAAVPGLRKLLREMSRTRDLERLLVLSRSWTEQLVGVCPNQRLRGILDDLHRLASRYERAALEHGFPVESALEKHTAILDRLERNDVAGAARLLGETWDDCLAALLGWLDVPAPAPVMPPVRAPRRRAGGSR